MSHLKTATELLSKGGSTAQTALQSATKAAVAYGKPALEKSTTAAAKATEWASQNPALATTMFCSGVVIVAPGVVVTPALSVLGFTPAGVKAASLATVVQSGIGNVAAGSTFATMQSAAAGGGGLAVVNGIAQVGGAVVGIGNAGWSWVRAKL